jgi:lysophospholipase L1-like esterase
MANSIWQKNYKNIQMKKLVLPFIFFFIFNSVQAQTQTLQWDSTVRPNNYAIKVEQFRSFPNSSTDIIFLGNSITAGTDWNELLGINNARNRGISGDITFGILERLDEITEGKPAKVFILIGINDIQRNIPDSVIVGNYKKMIQRIKSTSPATKIYFQTLLPVNNEFTQFKNHYNKDEHILDVNSQLKKIASEEQITLIDLHPHFLNDDKKLEKKYTMDGLHLNAAGYTLWASILKPFLNQ